MARRLPETAADRANLGMLLRESGQRSEGNTLLRGALAIYEQTIGPRSAQAEYVRRELGKAP